ncbi:RTA1 like protein-domain-containing protein [Lactarius indigo]|nr:RTA1 like protein-domain-containing protein [Lactarius indigo]
MLFHTCTIRPVLVIPDDENDFSALHRRPSLSCVFAIGPDRSRLPLYFWRNGQQSLCVSRGLDCIKARLSQKGCFATTAPVMSSSNNSQDDLQYGYVPTEWVCITFLSIFGISTFLHTVQAFSARFWWLIPSAILCGFLELTGWSGRLWSSQNPFLDKPYIMQAVTLIIAPTPLVAANFILLGRIIRRLGPQYSRLTPRRYTIIFVSCDIISLVVQAIGGSVASGTTTSASQVNLGSHIALGGTIFQLVAIIVYCACAAEFLIRYAHDRPVRWAAFILVRTVYRVIEFVDGWNGKVNTTQWYFVVFDGIMISLAMLTLNAFHPGVYLRTSDYAVPTSFEGLALADHSKTGNSEVRQV